MSSNDIHAIKKEIKVYLCVFGALLFLTIVTVAVSYLHLSLFWAVTVALIIATFKVSLVAGYFMHLLSERALVYTVLVFTVIFFIGVLVLPALTHHDPISGTAFHGHYGPSDTVKAHVH